MGGGGGSRRLRDMRRRCVCCVKPLLLFFSPFFSFKARQRGTVAATASLVTTSGLAGTASNYAADRWGSWLGLEFRFLLDPPNRYPCAIVSIIGPREPTTAANLTSGCRVHLIKKKAFKYRPEASIRWMLCLSCVLFLCLARNRVPSSTHRHL